MNAKKPTPEQIRQELLASSEYINILVETMRGYRVKFEAAGFSPTVAEQMSAAIVMKGMA